MKTEPFGEDRDDLRMGAMASLVARHGLDPKRHPVVDPDSYVIGVTGEGDFIFKYMGEDKGKLGNRKPPGRKEWEEFKAGLKAVGK